MRSSQLENKIIQLIKILKLNKADDMLIYYHYIRAEGVDINQVFSNKSYRIQNNISPFGSVERVIRKLHNKRPDLFNLLDEKLNKTEDYIKYNQGYEVNL